MNIAGNSGHVTSWMSTVLWAVKNDKTDISLLLEVTYFNGARLDLKFVSDIIIYFNKKEALKKSSKSFFYPKSLSRYQDVQIFIPLSKFLLPLSLLNL